MVNKDYQYRNSNSDVW